MRRDLRALVLAVALLLGAPGVTGTSPAAAEAPVPTPVPTPTDVPSTAFEVDDALLRWGINNESNNRGAAPGTFNLFSAGRLGDPTEGGQSLTDGSAGASWSNGRPAGWRAVAGNVRIEKRQPDGSYATATWAGTRTDSDGTPLGGYSTNTRFSDHQVVLAGGTGEVDPAAGEATIRWSGDFTVVYYSGLTFFSVSDPVLTVRDGVGRLTATTGGYATSMDDLAQWQAVPPRTGVVLADLGAVDLGQDLGFTAQPRYRGVKVTGGDQVTTGEAWGSFPQSFIDFQRVAGAAAYWFSSGGAVDRNKVPLPLAVSYAAGAPIVPETPGTGGPGTPTVENSAPPPPTPSPAPSSVPSSGPVVPPPAPAPPQRPVPAPVGSPVLAAARPAATVLPATGRPGRTSLRETSSAPWVAGFVLLGLAALVAGAPTAYRRLR